MRCEQSSRNKQAKTKNHRFSQISEKYGDYKKGLSRLVAAVLAVMRNDFGVIQSVLFAPQHMSPGSHTKERGGLLERELLHWASSAVTWGVRGRGLLFLAAIGDFHQTERKWDRRKLCFSVTKRISHAACGRHRRGTTFVTNLKMGEELVRQFSQRNWKQSPPNFTILRLLL